MDSGIRRKAKAINFGIIYGISAFGLARQLKVEQSEAASYIKSYFERYPGIQDYMERTKQYCREHGYVQTIFGRRCHVPAIHDSNPARRNFSERAAINAPLQVTAADILKRAMIRVPQALEQHGLQDKAFMLLTVHDELLFEVQESALDETARIIKQVMESATLPALQLSIPLTVDVGHGPSWDDAHWRIWICCWEKGLQRIMEIPSYKELLKLMWFLVWRHVVILMFVSMTIGWAVPVIFNSTVPKDSQYILEICIYGVLFLGITPFILKTLFQKQFQGFQVIFQRATESSSPSSS